MTQNQIIFDNKKILITGAASGIGRSVSVILSKLGAELILVDINNEGLDGTIEMCNNTALKVLLDLRKTETVYFEISEIIKDFGRIDGLVHSAGIPYISPLKFINHDKIQDVFSVNTYAGIELSKIFSDRNLSNESSSIVFISSIYGCVGSVANVGYSMSKSALHGITKSLALELASKKTRVNCIAPGFIDSEMLKEISNKFDEGYYQKITDLHPLGLGKPEDVSNVIIFLLSEMSRWVTGSIINVDGGYTAR